MEADTLLKKAGEIEDTGSIGGYKEEFEKLQGYIEEIEKLLSNNEEVAERLKQMRLNMQDAQLVIYCRSRLTHYDWYVIIAEVSSLGVGKLAW